MNGMKGNEARDRTQHNTTHVNHTQFSKQNVCQHKNWCLMLTDFEMNLFATQKRCTKSISIDALSMARAFVWAGFSIALSLDLSCFFLNFSSQSRSSVLFYHANLHFEFQRKNDFIS